jgi:hypothetical protein
MRVSCVRARFRAVEMIDECAQSTPRLAVESERDAREFAMFFFLFEGGDRAE